ncbi:MAG TPA: DNA ligase D [Chitinophagaceae bacterium]
MSLSLYQKKRKFSETPEPKGKEKSSKEALRFVIQKHDASSLHYDFRLEMEGVLKSWAVPKGPSLNPKDRRLAMMVEDHPYDYRTFEGVIPEDNYGSGTVIVWDEGTYEPAGGEGLSAKEQEAILLEGLRSRSLKLVLHGKKIKGLYALFQLRRDKEEKSWLLVKKEDGFSGDADIAEENKSVKSGRTLAEVAAAGGAELKHPEEDLQKSVARAKKAKPAKAAKTAAPAKKPSPAKKASLRKKNGNIKALLGDSFQRAREADMPAQVVPMMATLVDEPFDNDNWLYEIKWDGYRAVAYVLDGEVELVSRNGKPFTGRYKPVAEALSRLNVSAVFDGEIVAVDEHGLANFQLLQNWMNTPEAHLQFFIFDVLWLDGYDVTALPLTERKALLQKILPPDHEILKYSDHVAGKGGEFFRAALDQGLEGIMAKRGDSPYQVGTRTADWLKIKVAQRQEVIIAGFTEPRNTRQFFGALLLGAYNEEGELVYVGHTGSGFNRKSLEAIWNKLKPLEVEQCPFKKCPKSNMPATWVKPKLVCEIKFTEWTKDWIARHPIFMGLRTDKKARDVRIEKTKNSATMVKKSAPAKKAAPKKAATKKALPKKAAAKKADSSKAPAQKKSLLKTKTSGLQLSLDNGVDQTIVIGQQELGLTSLDKVYWPKEGTLKIDMVNHYLRMAPFILPYMLDRPQSMHRYPNGINAPGFYQKDVQGKVPEWTQKHTDFSESTDVDVDYLVCKDEATLIYMANLGCIEMHPWHSRVQSVDYPDWCLIDLDPEGISFDKVIECAHVVREVLESIGAVSYPKTSGSTGLHIYIPLGARYDYDQSKQLAELVVTLVNREIPDYTSIERSPAKRRNKIYLDYLQNRETQTAAAPYSLRPKPGVPVSTPLHWDEVKKGLTPTTWHIQNIYDRVRSEGDLFRGVLGKGINLEKVLQKLESVVR